MKRGSSPSITDTPTVTVYTLGVVYSYYCTFNAVLLDPKSA